MKALCFDGTALALREVPEPAPRPGEARVRVRMAGICNTDLEIARGYMGFERAQTKGALKVLLTMG